MSEAAGPRRLEVGWSVLVVVAALGLSLLPMLAGFVHSETFTAEDFGTAQSWARWDSNRYEEIAEVGYYFHRCGPEANNRRPDQWCGNAGWMPMLPILMRASSAATGAHLFTSGWAISQSAHLGTLALVWFGALKRRVSARSISALALAAVFPGLIYQSAVFPMSMATAALLATVLLASRERWLWASATASVAALSHTAALAIVPTLGIYLLWVNPWHTGRQWRVLVRRSVLFFGPVIAGLVAFGAYLQWKVGDWGAYLKIQAEYGHERLDPLTALWRRVTPLWTDAVANPSNWVSLQALLVSAIVIVLGIGAWRHRRTLTNLERLLVVYGGAFWLLPLTPAGSTASYWRMVALLVPVSALATRLPWPVTLAMAAASMVVASQHTRLFLENLLI